MIQLLGALPGAGFSTNAITLPSALRGHDTERAGVFDLREGDRGLRALLVVEAHHRAEIEIREHVAVAHDEALVDAFGRETDRARGAERLVLDRVAQRDVLRTRPGRSGRDAKWAWNASGRYPIDKHDLVDPVSGEPRQLALEVRLVRDRQQRFRHREGQRPEPRSLAADENDRFHGLVVAVAVSGVVDPVAPVDGVVPVPCVSFGNVVAVEVWPGLVSRFAASGRFFSDGGLPSVEDRLARAGKRDDDDVVVVKLERGGIGPAGWTLKFCFLFTSPLNRAVIHCNVPGSSPHLSPFLRPWCRRS